MLSSATWSLCLLPRQIFLGVLEPGDVRDHGHRAALRRPTAIDLEDRPSGARSSNVDARGIAQAFHPTGDQGVDVAVAVVSVLGQVCAGNQDMAVPDASSSLGTGYISVKRLLQTTMFSSSSV